MMWSELLFVQSWSLSSFLIIASLVVTVIFVVRRISKQQEGNLPPLVPKPWRENVRNMTTIEGATPCWYLKDIFDSFHNKLNMEGKDAENGVLLRLPMPQRVPFIVCTDYKVARVILEGDAEKGVKECEKSPLVRQFDTFPNRPTIFSNRTDNPYRHGNRKFLASAFSMKNLAYTFEVVFQNLLVCGRILQGHIDRAEGGSAEEVDIGEIILKLTFDIVMQSAFDTQMSTQLDAVPSAASATSTTRTAAPETIASTAAVPIVGINEGESEGAAFLRHNDDILRIVWEGMLNPFKKYFFWSPDHRNLVEARRFKEGVARRLLQEYRDKHGDQVRTSIMGHLVRNPYAAELDRISDMMVFITAGHETTAWTVTWLLLEVSRHPDVKKRLLSELDSAIPSAARHGVQGEKGADGSTAGVPFPSVSELMALPYLNMCIREVMRLWPVAGSGPRREVTEDLYFTTNGSTEPVLVPKGSTVQVNLFSMFRAPWVQEADSFLPERWSKENPQLECLKEMCCPFSLGRRNCIGQNLANVEIVMVAAYLMRYFDFALTSAPSMELFLTLKPTNVKMKVSARP